MRYGSVCSGIEAASVAWHPLGWEAAWLAEIEPFPSAVLGHHYPSVPNYGDMTALADRVSKLEIEAPNVLVGGTPCQAFSVAGLRQSLDDDRGQLTIKFLELADAIDNVRRTRGEPECIIVWENVPGVLSTKDNALGCFLAGLAGESEPLLPAGGKWSNAGCVFGPTRTVAWRVLDAQYFGVAQRRRRVFVIASARDDFNPAAVLFEFDGVRRDIAPSRTQRKDVAAGIDGSIDGRGIQRTVGISSGSDPNTMATLCATDNAKWGSNQWVKEGKAILHPTYGIPGNWIGRKPENGGNAVQPMDDLSPNLTSTDRHAVASAVCFQQNTRDEVRLIGGEGNLAGALAASAGMKQTNYIAQPIPINSMNAYRSPDADKQTGCGIGEEGATAELGDEVQNCLWASSGGGDKPHVLMAIPLNTQMALRGPNTSNTAREGLGIGRPNDPAFTLQAAHHHAVATAMCVRRLTPTECERLQGFPDGYTQVPHRGKPAADGPRYKSLGNSMAVPVMAWIGKRIDQETKLRETT